MVGVDIWDQENGPAPDLQPLTGLRVLGAWAIPPGDALLVRLEGGNSLQVCPVKFVGDGAAVQTTVAKEKPNSDWRFLDALPQVNREPMAGKRFGGMEGNVAVFLADDGTKFGASITLNKRVEWVKQRR
jgi:hypothetical protein